MVAQQGRKDLEPGAYFRKLEEKLDDFLHSDKKATYKINTGDPILIPLVMDLVKTGREDWEQSHSMSAALSLYRVANAAFRIYIQHLARDQVQALQQALYSLGCSETEEAMRTMCQEWCDETKVVQYIHVRLQVTVCIVDLLVGGACRSVGTSSCRPNQWRRKVLHSVPA